MSAAIRTPSDDLQHIQFEGCDVCVIAPEDYDALANSHAALVQELADFKGMNEMATEFAAQMKDQRDALVAALEKYGNHRPGCEWFDDMRSCNCGLRAALKAVRGES